ncbi:macro domain-containing protein [Aliifodinibius sp. S!AR15-10]|uniref:macro domain-containing protein n=1 Tax=Aliifodinibius sp. S!AR15-10 TaxID=2950437 RepID=UPI00285514CD|nr:macro domain-containing protein [Aliifodinibius sp. S!AR15-10]MDR8391247.1 macro domain-containing protein [Aliifodinibius sp. S!AR15-10]
MEKTEVSGVTIELKRGDIASQKDIEAIVNAANAQLKTGGGVAGAIHRAAGPGLAEEAKPMAPIKPGEAVITGAHNLPNEYVIHCLGPVYGRDKPEEELLANCYKNALDRAEENGITSVAFPSISTGAFGYPMEDAARVAFQSVKGHAEEGLSSVKLIRFVLWGEDAMNTHQQVMEEVFG